LHPDPLLLAPVRCEVERALARSRKKGVTRGVAGATGVTGVPAHQPSSSTSSEGWELCIFFFGHFFALVFRVAAFWSGVFWDILFVICCTQNSHTHRRTHFREEEKNINSQKKEVRMYSGWAV